MSNKLFNSGKISGHCGNSKQREVEKSEKFGTSKYMVLMMSKNMILEYLKVQ